MVPNCTFLSDSISPLSLRKGEQLSTKLTAFSSKFRIFLAQQLFWFLENTSQELINQMYVL